MNPLVTSEFLVLRKTPYAETSLVVAGLTPDHGQVHLILKGARRLGKRSFPALDLFRLVRVTYREGKGDLHSPSEVETIEDYGNLVRKTELYQAAGQLARFALANVLPGVAHPNVFQALRVALARFADAAQETAGLADAAHVCLHLAYLHEAGWLPTQTDQRTRRQCARLLDMAGGGTPLVLPTETWRELRNWTDALLRHTE